MGCTKFIFSQAKTSFINLLTDPQLFQVTATSPNATVRNQAFNLFNRTNFIGVNNVLGAACTTSDGANFVPCTAAGAVPLANFNLRGRKGLRTTDPLGFTSAFDPRQLQFGVRFNF